MGMTSRGATYKGGSRAIINPFMDNGQYVRIPITIDNRYDRGRIPPFSLWAPSDISNYPWKYMPYIPPIPIRDYASTTVVDIDNEWHDYFRAGDEVLVLDVSEISSNDLVFIGKAGTDETDDVLGTNTCTISTISAKNGGTNGTGYTKVTLTDALAGAATEGELGTGDILVLAGHSTSLAVMAYQSADLAVIMEQEFNFVDPLSGTAGEGGYITESAVYSYTGRIDQNYISYYTALNTFDSTPAIQAGAANTKRFTSNRLNFCNIYRG